MLIPFAIHIAVLVLLILLAPAPLNVIRLPRVRKPPTRILLQPLPSPAKGGGGGASTPLPPSRGHLPRFALRPFARPVTIPVTTAPKLTVEPAFALTTNPELQTIDGPIGISNGLPGPPSGGPGGRGGIGSGPDGGIGKARVVEQKALAQAP